MGRKSHPILGCSLAAAILFFMGETAPAGQDADVELLKVTCSIKPKRLSRGEEGKVVLKLDIKEGIRISAQPSLVIEFEPIAEAVFPKNFFTAADLEMLVVEENGQRYLDLAKPVEIPFTVSPEAKKGSMILEGRIKYFARSTDEDWCYKTTAKFSGVFSVRPGSIAKKQPHASASRFAYTNRLFP